MSNLEGLAWTERAGVRFIEGTLPGTRVAFSTRVGGISEPPFDTLNLGLLTGDDPDPVRENRRRLAAAVGVDPDRVVMGLQVHGSIVASHQGPQEPSRYAVAERGDDVPEVDGHATDVTGLAMAVLVADCLPVALARPGGVAMLHCGWRGLAGGILAGGAEALDGDGEIVAAIGPGIGPCCYEVGEGVRAAFADLDEVSDGRMLDLRAVVRAQLQSLSIEVAADADLCTSCNPDLFFSHRRDGERTGRQAGMAWLD